jgi:error-prone DNA polymerase
MPEHHLKPGAALDEDAHGLPPLLGDGLDPLPRYAELYCLSNFSFQRGAAHPQELVRRAYDLGYEALAITDECSVAGVVRALAGWDEYLRFIHRLDEDRAPERRERPFQLLYGSEFDFGDGRLVAIARDLKGWGGLCQFISDARNDDGTLKGQYKVGWDTSNLALLNEGCELLFVPQRQAGVLDAGPLRTRLAWLRQRFGTALWLAVEQRQQPDDNLWLAELQAVGEQCDVPLVAAGGVLMDRRSRKPLHDVITAVRLGKPVAQCGFELQANAERHLRSRVQLAAVFPRDLLDATLLLAQRCNFSLREISYNYPQETVPPGESPIQVLERLTWAGASERYPQGVPQKVQDLLHKELALIQRCDYEMFFLTVHDIVRFARSRQILCQGRGSAANSVVCFCLGVTAMDPMLSNPLLERFISENRKGDPPDIDVDFEHERREEVIQYIYDKYGRHRAAIAAVVISYRTRSAIRDVGKALDVPEPLIDAFSREHHWFDDELAVDRLEELALRVGAALDAHRAALWLALTQGLMGFPRHLSQHVGGFVLTQTPLTRLVPVEKASMKDRSVIQWDKDDLEHMGMLKVDVLALGMLTAIRRCLDLVALRRGGAFTRYDITPEDPPTYEMIRRADTVGVFQIESRAQMSMLPRLKPKEFYDLVVEVAIVRPGPISGGMVHPYLKARERAARKEAIVYERSRYEPEGTPPRLQKALERTLGIPIFQEQVMEISMIAAGFSGAEADGLRRAMAAWKRTGNMTQWRERLIGGMLANGYELNFAERIFEQVKGFADYGFPESHAYSFALLAYESSWLKCHEPECFLAAMLNAQPMGFYPPAQLIQDAVRHGVQVLPPDVSHSHWDTQLANQLGSDSNSFSDSQDSRPAVRLGLRLVGGLSAGAGQRIEAARRQAAFTSTEDLSLRAQLDVRDLNALAAGDALKSLSGHRRQQVWDAAARHRAPALLRGAPVNEEALLLDAAHEGEEIVFDYASLGLTLRRHPLALLRERLARKGFMNAEQLAALPHGRTVSACGIVTVRQQPQTAKGTMFVTLEDETGPVNVIVWKSVREAQRDALLRSRLLAVRGTWQRDVDNGGQVCHLVAVRLMDLTPLLGRLAGQSSKSRDFH